MCHLKNKWHRRITCAIMVLESWNWACLMYEQMVNTMVPLLWIYQKYLWCRMVFYRDVFVIYRVMSSLSWWANEFKLHHTPGGQFTSGFNWLGDKDMICQMMTRHTKVLSCIRDILDVSIQSTPLHLPSTQELTKLNGSFLAPLLPKLAYSAMWFCFLWHTQPSR